MSCWHVLMGKRYSLLASRSGSVPGTCTVASWTVRSSGSDDTEADAEHDEMVNELQDMVLIGDQWANAADVPTPDDDPLPSNFDPKTATMKPIANEDSDDLNKVDRSTVDGTDPASNEIGTCKDDFKDLYSTIAESTSIVQSSAQTVNSISAAERAECRLDELLPLPVYDDTCPPLPSSSSSMRLGGDKLQVASGVEILKDSEEPNDEVQLEQTTLGDDNRVSLRRVQEEYYNVKEIEGLDGRAVGGQVNEESRVPEPCASSHCDGELTDVTSRRSQLSETLRNNLEKLLQRGPVSVAAAKTYSRRRRQCTSRTTSGKQRQTTTSRDRKQQHRYHQHNHHHHHHHHHRQHNHHHWQEEECELDDVKSLATDTNTVRSLSATSDSDISSISEGIFILDLQ